MSKHADSAGLEFDQQTKNLIQPNKFVEATIFLNVVKNIPDRLEGNRNNAGEWAENDKGAKTLTNGPTVLT